MSLPNIFAKMKLSPDDAMVIFDRDEPVGRPTDLVMPRRRWFRRNKETDGQPGSAIPSDARSTSTT